MVRKGNKNKLIKGLTEHDVLTWEEEKMKYQKRMGRKVTDLEFFRYLLMSSSRPVISSKEGVRSKSLTGEGPIYDKKKELLQSYSTHSDEFENALASQEGDKES
jgi:hypothetical protein